MPSFQAELRRLRLLAFEVFFLGTAMVIQVLRATVAGTLPGRTLRRAQAQEPTVAVAARHYWPPLPVSSTVIVF